MRKGEILGKIFGIALVILAIFSICGALPGIVNIEPVSASPGIIYVPDNYSKIQSAVDNATSGDTIIVRDGNYTENVDVNKTLTIQSANGTANCVVNASNPYDSVFYVTANWVNITGFTVKDATGSSDAGIYLKADHCNISSNNVTNNYLGIYLWSSSDNTLTNNTANGNDEVGIYLWSSNNNTLTNNTASNNYVGIWLDSSSNNTLTNNTAWNNTWRGISLSGSSNNILTNNTMSGNNHNFGVYGYQLPHFMNDVDTSNEVDGKPIYYWVNHQDEQVPSDAGFVAVVNSTNITVKDLTLTKNSDGVLLAYTQNSTVENVTATDNVCGIWLYSSSNNTLTTNTAKSNPYEIYLGSSSNNTIYNNYFRDAYDDGTNTWNTTKTNGTNIVGGPYLGGNYWSNYTSVDANTDGLGDTPYNISGGSNKDYLPLLAFEDATLIGNVTLYRAEGPGDPTWETGLVVMFFDKFSGFKTSWSPKYATTDDHGYFIVDGIAGFSYDIGIKNYTTLSKMVYGEVFTLSKTTAADFGTLIEADCDGNDRSEGMDYAKVLNNYNARKIADPTFWATNALWKADYTRDDKIDGSDYASVLNNYNKRGDVFYYMH
jgi:nitrous oxidase accessory protein